MRLTRDHLPKFSLILFLSIIFLFSCADNNNDKGNRQLIIQTSPRLRTGDSIGSLRFRTIDIDEYDPDKIRIKDVVDEIITIKLETKSDCLISRIEKYVISENYIYLLDTEKEKAVYCFSLSGKYINKYNSFGKGPNEFTKLNDLSAFEDKVYILINYGQILEFDHQLNLISSFQTENNCTNFEKIEDGFVLSGFDIAGDIKITDNLGKTKYIFLNPTNHKMARQYNVLPNGVLFHYLLTDSIYFINSNTFKAVRHIIDYASGYSLYYESQNTIMVYNRPSHRLISKKTNKEFNLIVDSDDPYYNMIFDNTYTFGIYRDYFISKLEPYKVFDSPYVNDARIQELKKGLNEGSNPIIVLTRFKSDL